MQEQPVTTPATITSRSTFIGLLWGCSSATDTTASAGVPYYLGCLVNFLPEWWPASKLRVWSLRSKLCEYKKISWKEGYVYVEEVYFKIGTLYTFTDVNKALCLHTETSIWNLWKRNSSYRHLKLKCPQYWTAIECRSLYWL